MKNTLVSDADLGWLAGVLDSEGAIGIRMQSISKVTGFSVSPLVQMETTCEKTSKKVLDICERLGVNGAAYFYRARKPQHKPSWSIRIGRLMDINVLSRAMEPVAVTKQEQWQLILEFTSRRLSGKRFTNDGVLRLGGVTKHPYTSEEVDLFERLKALNRKGPKEIHATNEVPVSVT